MAQDALSVLFLSVIGNRADWSTHDVHFYEEVWGADVGLIPEHSLQPATFGMAIKILVADPTRQHL